MTWRYPDGRTMRAASDAGDWYVVEFRDERGTWLAESTCPGTAGIDEAVYAARLNHPRRIGQFAHIKRVLPGSQIGCMFVEDAGTITL